MSADGEWPVPVRALARRLYALHLARQQRTALPRDFDALAAETRERFHRDAAELLRAADEATTHG